MKLWKTKPRCSRRKAVSSCSLSLPTSRPARRKVPEVGRSRPPMRFRSVLLPLPELPTSATNSPAWMVSERSSRAVTVPAPMG
ncbi:hypothetical protein D3C86_2130430 [compost metagenome]